MNITDKIRILVILLSFIVSYLLYVILYHGRKDRRNERSFYFCSCGEKFSDFLIPSSRLSTADDETEEYTGG